MGFLSKLFGQPNVDVPRILNAVAQGGGQGIVQVPYDVFSAYLLKHGSEHQSGGGGMECFLNLGGKRQKVVIDRGLFTGLKAGQTMVTVKGGIAPPAATDAQLAGAFEKAVSRFITDSESAYAVAWYVFTMAESDYLNDCWGQGKLDAKVEHLRSPVLAEFHKGGHREVASPIDWHQLNALLGDSLISIEDPLRRLKISYAVADSLVTRWQLVG